MYSLFVNTPEPWSKLQRHYNGQLTYALRYGIQFIVYIRATHLPTQLVCPDSTRIDDYGTSNILVALWAGRHV